MPHNTATPTLERRVTRSMGRPLESVHNTTTASKQGKAGPSAPARGTISEPRRKAVDDWRREVVRHTETAQKVSSTSSHAGPHRGLAPPPRLSYQVSRRATRVAANLGLTIFSFASDWRSGPGLYARQQRGRMVPGHGRRPQELPRAQINSTSQPCLSPALISC